MIYELCLYLNKENEVWHIIPLFHFKKSFKSHGAGVLIQRPNAIKDIRYFGTIYTNTSLRVGFSWLTPFRGAKFGGVLCHLGANLEVCVHGWVALMCESDPPGTRRVCTENNIIATGGERTMSDDVSTTSICIHESDKRLLYLALCWWRHFYKSVGHLILAINTWIVYQRRCTVYYGRFILEHAACG